MAPVLAGLRLAAVAILVGGCTVLPITIETPPPTPKADWTQAPPTPTFAPQRTPPAGPVVHGQPYTADEMFTILVAARYMPAQLRTTAIAEAIAPRIWSWDGQPYQETDASGECEESGRCILHFEGTPGFAEDRPHQSDGYSFEIETGSGVILNLSTLGHSGFPHELKLQIDAAIRHIAGNQVGDLPLRNVAWLVPPPDDAYRAEYAAGSTEGSPLVTVVYDRATDTILEVVESQF